LKDENDFKKVAFSAILFSTSMYILLPTPDELAIHPILGMFLSYAFHIPFVYGVLISMILYRSLGGLCLLGALLIGVKPIYVKFKEKCAEKRNTAFIM